MTGTRELGGAELLPAARRLGWFSRVGRHLYRITQLRIHVIVTHAFLRSLARLDLPQSVVGALAAARTSAAAARRSARRAEGPLKSARRAASRPARRVISRSFERSWPGVDPPHGARARAHHERLRGRAVARGSGRRRACRRRSRPWRRRRRLAGRPGRSMSQHLVEVVAGRRARPGARSSLRGHSLPMIRPPMHLIAEADSTPSGVPPMPHSRSTAESG